jgi:hypothetical protein
MSSYTNNMNDIIRYCQINQNTIASNKSKLKVSSGNDPTITNRKRYSQRTRTTNPNANAQPSVRVIGQVAESTFMSDKFKVKNYDPNFLNSIFKKGSTYNISTGIATTTGLGTNNFYKVTVTDISLSKFEVTIDSSLSLVANSSIYTVPSSNLNPVYLSLVFGLGVRTV